MIENSQITITMAREIDSIARLAEISMTLTCLLSENPAGLWWTRQPFIRLH